jgi:hypothetical protein
MNRPDNYAHSDLSHAPNNIYCSVIWPLGSFCLHIGGERTSVWGLSRVLFQMCKTTIWYLVVVGNKACRLHVSTYGDNKHSNNYKWGTRWNNWLRHCATSRKVACSIPDGVTGIFHWHNPSGNTMALELTQPLTEMGTRNISWQPSHLHVLTVFKSGGLNLGGGGLINTSRSQPFKT